MPDYSDDYLRFYEAYPRKEGKADGLKAFGSLSQTDQAAALADVEKRKRLNAYSANKKLIQLPASYLRARRWEDDWVDTLESSRKGDDQFVGLGALQPKPEVETFRLPWRERLINRLFLSYVMESHKGLPEVKTALGIKRELLEEAEILDEEPAEQALIIGDLYMNRMDLAYGLKCGTRALNRAKLQKRRAA